LCSPSPDTHRQPDNCAQIPCSSPRAGSPSELRLPIVTAALRAIFLIHPVI